MLLNLLGMVSFKVPINLLILVFTIFLLVKFQTKKKEKKVLKIDSVTLKKGLKIT